LKPFVSVIIPNYNHAPYLEQRITSVLQQTFTDFEVILLDDCSTDSSRQLLEKYYTHPKVSKVILNDQNSGNTFKQWNRGVAEASGRYVWIAESDDYADPLLLERLVARLEEDATVCLAYCQSWMVDAAGEASGLWRYGPKPHSRKFVNNFVEEGSRFIVASMTVVNAIPNASAVLFRRDAYLRAGGADPSYRLAGDWQTWLSLLKYGKVAYLAMPLNYFRTHTSNVRLSSEKSGAYLEETARIVQYLATAVPMPPDPYHKMMSSFLDTWLHYVDTRKVSRAKAAGIVKSLAEVDGNVSRRLLKKLVQRPRQLLNNALYLFKIAGVGSQHRK